MSCRVVSAALHLLDVDWTKPPDINSVVPEAFQLSDSCKRLLAFRGVDEQPGSQKGILVSAFRTVFPPALVT